MKTFFRTVWGILREISDENSYARYLRTARPRALGG